MVGGTEVTSATNSETRVSDTRVSDTSASEARASEITVSETLLAVLAGHLHSIPADVDLTNVELRDLGLDSMTAIELVIDIEDTFGTQFPEDRLVRETFATFGSLETVVRAMIEQS